MDHISVYGLMLIKYVWHDVVLLLQNWQFEFQHYLS